MAEIRFNYGDKFTQTSDSNTGIGSTIPAGKLDIAGGTSAGSLRVSGIATLSSYQGFVNTKLTSTENIIVEAGQSGSVSGEVVVGTGQTTSVSTGATTGQGGIQSLKVYEIFMPPVGGIADRPTDVKPGMVYYNKDFKTIEFWDGNFWKQVDNTTRRGRGVVMGGTDGPTYQRAIEFFNIATRGNSQNFGSLTDNRRTSGGCSSSIRGLIGGGSQQPSGNVDIIEYITIASEGDSIDFGNLTSTREHPSGSSSSSTRGLWAGGHPNTNIIEYVEIATLGNALDFGDCMSAQHAKGMCSSPTRGVIAEGTPSATGQLSFITIASKGNAVRFGDLTYTCHYPNSSSNQVRGIFAMGYDTPAYSYDLNYITIASEGNGVDFGKASYNGYNGQGCASGTRAMTGLGGYDSSNYYNVIEFVEIASLGNPVDFGDISHKKYLMAVVSDCHGGLGGF